MQKVAASRGRMTVPQTRKGRRPMRVETLLRKEKEGTMYKQAYSSMRDELLKIAEGEVTSQEAAAAYKRLKKLEETQPTVGELGRGALAGAAVGTGAGLVSKAISPGALLDAETGARGTSGLGELAEGFRGLRGAKLKKAPAIIGRGIMHAARLIAAPAAGSAVFGAGLPIARGYLDREAEKETLEQYLDASRRSRLSGQIRRHLGV